MRKRTSAGWVEGSGNDEISFGESDYPFPVNFFGCRVPSAEKPLKARDRRTRSCLFKISFSCHYFICALRTIMSSS